MIKHTLTFLSIATASTLLAQTTPDLTLLKKNLPENVEINNVKESAIKGLYEVQIGGQMFYVSADGKIGIHGELIDLATRTSITDQSLSKWRKNQLDSVKDAEKIVFKATDEKHVVDVFTDITCGYCVKLHEQVKDYNDKGITIRYMAFPRGGVTSDVAKHMQNIWCATDSKQAMADAKLNRKMPAENAECKSNTVTEQYTLGVDLGINGTPAMFFADGSMQPGYLPPAQLLQRLDSTLNQESKK